MVISSNKRCTKCHQIKPIDEFYFDRTKPDGRLPRCRTCKKIDRHQSYIKNPTKANQYSRHWRTNNRKRVDEAAREWKNKNPDKVFDATHKYQSKYPDRVKASHKKWIINNKEKRQIITTRARHKRRNTLKGNLSHRISGLILHSLKKNKNGYHWESLVDYTLDDLKGHLEKYFLPGMSWDNRNKWHIDHIIPIAAFSFDKPEDIDFKKCWAFSNLQPLWAIDNMRKGSKILS